MDAQAQQIGAQYDILDKAVAGRAGALLKKEWIYPEDYQEWYTDYSQLASFAGTYSGTKYIRDRWPQEDSRYSQIGPALQAKIRTANPANYDTKISIYSATDLGSSSGGGFGCGCGSGGSVQPDYGSHYQPVTPRSASQNIFLGDPSLGDIARQNYGNSPIPFFPNPDAPQRDYVDEKSLLTQVLAAIVIGAMFYIIHLVTKKK